MPTSSAVTDGQQGTAAQYNNLRTDVITTHFHDGTDGYDLFKFARKASSESVGDDILQNDDDLFFTVVSGETWHFVFHLDVSTTANADFKFTFTAPTLTASKMIATIFDAAAPSTFQNVSYGTAITNTISLTNATTAIYVRIEGYVIPSANGTVQLQWAQNADDGANLTSVTDTSWFYAVRVA